MFQPGEESLGGKQSAGPDAGHEACKSFQQGGGGAGLSSFAADPLLPLPPAGVQLADRWPRWGAGLKTFGPSPALQHGRQGGYCHLLCGRKDHLEWGCSRLWRSPLSWDSFPLTTWPHTLVSLQAPPPPTFRTAPSQQRGSHTFHLDRNWPPAGSGLWPY